MKLATVLVEDIPVSVVESSPHQCMEERQEFIHNGNTWRNGGINIFEKLKVGQLQRKEFNIPTEGMYTSELEETFKSIR